MKAWFAKSPGNFGGCDTVAAKKKRRAKSRKKSFKRIIILVGILIVTVISLLTLRNAVFSEKSEAVVVKPSPSAIVIEEASKDIGFNNEISEIANAANASQASYDEANREISESISKNKGIKVKVVNHSRNTGDSEKLRAILEINGFTVSAGNDKSLKRVSSVIIEKKDDISGEAVSKLVNIKRIRKEIEPDSRFDIVVVIGDDF